jgi:hypothetical protein
MTPRKYRFLNVFFAFALLLSMQLTACGGSVETEVPVDDTTSQQTAEPATEATEVSTAEPGPTGAAGTWLVMMYEDADDEVLEEDMVFDLNEAERVGSTDQVTIIAQMDRLDGGFDGDGNWTTTKRFLVTQDDDLENIHSQELDDIGEVNMGNKDTLIDFATWAINSYPADHYVLILSDHGAGWNGGWTDHDPDADGKLSTQDIDDALGTIIADTGIGAFDLVGFDACLMGQLEVMSAIAPHAMYAVGSEETEPSLGWAYTSFLTALNENTAMSGGDLGKAIVESYIKQDIRITDDAARSVFAGGNFTASSVADELSKGVTLTAVDLSAIQDMDAAVNELATALANIDQETVAQARAYAQSYTSIWWEGIPPSYIDLGHFVDLLLENTDDPAVVQAAKQVKTALANAVVAEVHGNEKPASTGLTIFFPNSELYGITFDKSVGYEDMYPAFVGRFATASLWDDFLTYHYTGQTFDPASADLAVLTPAESTQNDFTQAAEDSAPEAGADVVAPGAGELSIAPINVSASEIGPDGTVTLSTEITGSNIAYVYYYVSYYNESDGSYLTADEGYINSGDIKEVGGVYYPDWGNDGVISIEYDWEPTLYYMSDGNEANDQFAYFEPTVYGTEVDTYTVRGTYTFADTGTEMDAAIDFYGSDMQTVWGFTGDENSTGAWHEINPQPGDTFTITDEWLDFDQNPDGEFVDYVGGTMTFGDTPFTMVPYYAYSGTYALAIGVEDMDGNTTWEFTVVTVTP